MYFLNSKLIYNKKQMISNLILFLLDTMEYDYITNSAYRIWLLDFLTILIPNPGPGTMTW